MVEVTWFSIIKNESKTISDTFTTTRVDEEPKQEEKRCWEKLKAMADAIRNKPFFYEPTDNVKETWKNIGGNHDNGVQDTHSKSMRNLDAKGRQRRILSTNEEEIDRMLQGGNTLQNLHIGSTEEYSFTCNPMPESVACEALELIMSAKPNVSRISNRVSKSDSRYEISLDYQTTTTRYGELPYVFYCYVAKNDLYDTLALRYYMAQSTDMKNFKDITVEDLDWRKW